MSATIENFHGIDQLSNSLLNRVSVNSFKGQFYDLNLSKAAIQIHGAYKNNYSVIVVENDRDFNQLVEIVDDNQKKSKVILLKTTKSDAPNWVSKILNIANTEDVDVDERWFVYPS